MSVDAAQKALLYFVELLMGSDQPTSITQLAGHFGSQSFTPEMRLAAGVNEAGLRKLLLRYPSLFTLNGNMVSLCTSTDTNHPASSPVCFPDVTAEMDAVEYFRGKLERKGDQWVAVKSLAGHLSQAPAKIRQVVGAQLEFAQWLRKHPYIFELSGYDVRLQKDVIVDTRYTEYSNSRTALDVDSQNGLPDSDNGSVCMSETSFEDCLESLNIGLKRKIMSLLKELIRAKGCLPVDSVMSQMIMHVPIELLTVIHRIDLVDLIRKHPKIFYISDNKSVSLVKKSHNLVDMNSANAGVRLTGSHGAIYHLSKLWGIIDLGQHEHVFFDRSIIEKPEIEDLRLEYHVGEMLHFDAVLAPSSSRAKWKAVSVWKEPAGNVADQDIGIVVDSPSSPSQEEIASSFQSSLSASELNNFKKLSYKSDGNMVNVESNVSEVCDDNEAEESFERELLDNEMRNVGLCLISDLKMKLNIDHFNTAKSLNKSVDVACQTVSTGSIIATQFYFSD